MWRSRCFHVPKMTGIQMFALQYIESIFSSLRYLTPSTPPIASIFIIFDQEDRLWKRISSFRFHYHADRERCPTSLPSPSQPPPTPPLQPPHPLPPTAPASVKLTNNARLLTPSLAPTGKRMVMEGAMETTGMVLRRKGLQS